MARNGLAKGLWIHPEGHTSTRQNLWHEDAGLRQDKPRNKEHRGLGQEEKFWAWLHSLPVKPRVLSHARARENKKKLAAFSLLWCSRGLLTRQTIPFLWSSHQYHLELHLPPVPKPHIQTYAFHCHSDCLVTTTALYFHFFRDLRYPLWFQDYL